MPNLSIKDVPEALAEALRQRAAKNHRSLQGELMALLEAAVGAEYRVAEPTLPAYATTPASGKDDLLARLDAIAARRPSAGADSPAARSKRRAEILAQVNPAFRAADRLTREQLHDRGFLRQLGI